MMRITLKPGPDTRLPLLREVPPLRLARLEGNNGIGKTLTIRLLQVCTGRSPYLEQKQAWGSFRERIGAVRVRVAGLNEVDAIEWTLRPAELDADPVAEPSDDCFDIRIGGRRGSLAEAKALFGVERLAGDQGLAETLSQQIAADEAGVSARVFPLVAAEDSPLAEVLEVLDDALDTARRVDGTELLRKRTAAQRAAEQLEEARQSLRTLTAREQALREAWELQTRLAERERVGEGLDRKIAELDDQLSEHKDALATVQRYMKEAEKRAAQSDEARRTIANARKREQRRAEEVVKLTEDLARLRVVADVPEDRTASGLKTALQKALAELEERYVAIDAVPLMRALTDDLLTSLRAAEEKGLGKQILVEGGATVSELRVRLEERWESLRAVSPTTEGAALLARIKAVRQRLSAIDELLEVSRDLAKASRLARKAQEEIEEATKQADAEANQRLENLRSRARRLDGRVQETSAQRTALLTMAADAGSRESLDHLRARLKARLQELGTTAGKLESLLAAHAVSLREAELAFRAAEDADRAAKRAASALERDFERAVNLLAHEKRFEWLRGHLDDALVMGEAPLKRRLEHLQSLGDRLDAAADRANRVRGQVQAVQQALSTIKDALRRSQNGGPPGLYHDELLRGYEAEFRETFADPRVAELLLGEGARVRDMSLQPDRRAVTFEDAQGVLRHQPLEAFSRGQQAFAYTKARLATLDALGGRPQHRLVVLDEFGAFIARDRLGELTKLLADRVNTTPGEQILVILPASTDYAARARLADGERAKTLQRYAEQMKKKGFVFEELPA